MQPAIEYREHDRQVWEEELDAFVPQRMFDAHCHLVDLAHVPRATLNPMFERSTDLQRLRDASAQLYPGRQMEFLALGTPLVGIDVAAHTLFVANETRGQAGVFPSRLITPACRVEDVYHDVKTHGFVGLKPYRIFSVTGDWVNCRIADFFTHGQMEVANELGLWVTMHLSRVHGCADEENLRDLHEYATKRYPRIKWILAHCARSFTYWPIEKAIERLRDIPNLWYDVSAVNDVRPMLTLFRRENIERILFGSDLIDATAFHGKYEAFGRAWFQVQPDLVPSIQFKHCDGRPILAIYEQLLCMKHAAEIAELSRDDVDAIFWRNAEKVFGNYSGAV